MSKTISFEFWKLTIIDEKNNASIEFKDIVQTLEHKPLDLSQQGNRYFCASGVCNKAISTISHFVNGVLVNFSKYENENIKGSFLNSGEVEFDAIDELKKATKRADVTMLDYNGIKIYSNGVVLFQTNKKANTALQFKDYLCHHFKDHYLIELLPIYVDDLFTALDGGEIQYIELTVGFAPENSLDAFDNESYTGATKCKIQFTPENKSFLKKSFFIKTLTKKALEGFGSLNKGIITKASAKVSNRKARVSLEEYQLKDKKEFKDIHKFWMEPNQFFDEIYNQHNDFLKEYISRDTRY